MKKDKLVLLLIILTAIVVRVLFIWIDRPEFVGWFNHTYYYFVEVKGLLENGKLPFPDMPLIFYIYALTAKILIRFGTDFRSAIVISTRLWMSVIPALISIPVYLTLLSITNEEKLRKSLWAIVFVSAILPLSLMHVPELLQKNAFGLLLLAVFMFFSKRFLTKFNLKNLLFLVSIFLLIVFTHFGTTGVTILYLISISLAFLHLKKISKKNIFLISSSVVVPFILSVGGIYFTDSQRYERILFYIQNSFNTSFLGLLLSPSTNFNQKIIVLFAILIPVLLVVFLFQLYKKNKKTISEENKLFWLSNIIFIYLLMMPIYDQLLFGRLALYTYLPLLFIITFILQFSINKTWIRKGILIIVVFGALLMAFGEFMNDKFRNRDVDKIYNDLLKIKEKQNFHSNDLIITKYGAEHVCIWFLETKAGLITSLNISDFDKYENIYILNPIENSFNNEENKNYEELNRLNEFQIMSQNIMKPKDAEIIYKSEYIQLLFLDSVPEEWKFDLNGNWISYKK